MHQQKYSVNSQIMSEVAGIKTISDIFVNLKYTTIQREVVVDFLAKAVQNSGFYMLALSDTNGLAITDQDKIIDIRQRDYFQKAVKGETCVSSLISSDIVGAEIITISTPVYVDSRIVGIVVGVYPIDQLKELFSYSFNGAGYAFICDSQGNIISRKVNDHTITTTGKNLFEDFKNAEFINNNGQDTFDVILNKISQGGEGRATYTINGQKRLMHYAPVGINDWYIFSIAPQKVISTQANEMIKSAMWLTTFIMVVFVSLITYQTLSQTAYSKKLYKLAYIDQLTGIPNLEKFKLEAEALLNAGEKEKYFLIKFDLVNFKIINELYGIEAGDEVIKCIAGLLAGVMHRQHYAYARVNADEFVIMESFESREQIEERRAQFESAFAAQRLKIGKHKIEFRYGRYIVNSGEKDISVILEKVNLAHRLACLKKATYIFDYDDAMKQVLLKEAKIENRMEEALRNGEFRLYLQPKYSLIDETVAGAEALVRWVQEGRVVSPVDFIPLFEKNGFITKLDIYIFEQVCKLIQSWLSHGVEPVVISVNFSRLHLSNEKFVNEIWEIADRYGVPRKYLEVELTESIMYKNEDTLEAVLEKLHSAGFSLSMDDFGTGYSSLGLLKNLPVDVIKIDRSFFTGSKHKKRTKTVVGNVLRMAKELGIQTVAEGVETQEHIELLRSLQCDMVQGYYYAKPMPAEELILNTQKV